MGSRRTTFEKLQRERDKKAKAAAKRERRQQKAAAAQDASSDGDPRAVSDSTGQESATELLVRIEEIHRQFDADEISHEELEEQKAEIFARLALLPAD